MQYLHIKRLWPELPARLVLSLSIITIILIPLLFLESETDKNQMIVLMLLLAFGGLELLEHKLHKIARVLSTVTLVLCGIITETVIYLTDYSLIYMLYGLIVFDAYFILKPRVSYNLAVFYAVLSLAHQINIFSPVDIEPLHSWIIQQLSTIFLLILARAFQQEKEQQQYTEKLLRELKASHRELQTYAAQIAELAAAEERNRLARDIHDSVGHNLTAVNIQLEKALVYRKHDLDQSFQAVREAKQAAHQALQDVRESVAGLRELNASLKLKSSLKALITQVATTQLTVDFQFNGDETSYNRMVLLTLYRTAQEGLTNIQKHAHATHAKLDVQLGAEQAQMRLTDNGNGFIPGKARVTPADNSGYGLQGIRERVELLRGQVTIDSKPEHGTTLLITIPKDPITLTAGAL